MSIDILLIIILVLAYLRATTLRFILQNFDVVTKTDGFKGNYRNIVFNIINKIIIHVIQSINICIYI